ncbi:hypothetical protein ACH5RR_002814 [Cinchona calisaya]|uniref:TF-B3 domain-containing protein n=1 Tax=Cinchona calisaya TaxID=153742 RepID=A0ABD3AT17_9GENT
MDDQSRKIDDDDDDEQKKKQKGKNKRSHDQQSQEEELPVQPSRGAKKTKKFDLNEMLPPDPRNAMQLPPRFKEYIQNQFKEQITIGEEILVMEKKLWKTDLEKLHISSKIMEACNTPNFLNPDEARDSDLYVDIVGPNPQLNRNWVYLQRKKWNSANPNSLSYFLKTRWNEVAKENQLQEGQILQLWAVRVAGKLWFVLLTDKTDGYQRMNHIEEGKKVMIG